MPKFNKAKKDKVTALLPVSYKQLFCFTYRTNLILLFKLSLVMSIFCLPFMASVLFKNIFEASISSNTALSNEEISVAILNFRSVYGFIISTCFLLVGIGLSGSFYVMKQYLTNEGMVFKRDFFKGIKKNWKGYLLLTALFAYSLAAANFVINLATVSSYYGVLLILFVIISFCFLSVYLISLNIYQTYTVSFFKLIKNSFLVFISQLPIACLSLICSILPLVVAYFFNITLMNFIAWLIYICLGFGHSVLTIVIFNLYMLDESVNKRQFKEIYRKGLFDSSNDVVVDEGFKNDAQDL